MKELILQETIKKRIFIIRGQKVMLDRDLAELYGVLTKVLNQAVKRNIDRFPGDFMFSLSKQETLKVKRLQSSFSRSQFVTLKQGQNVKYLPNAFTEQGVAMLSSVLNSKKAIHINIAVVRVFVKLREFLFAHKGLEHKLKELEQKVSKHDGDIRVVFDAIRQLMVPPEKPKKRIGFLADKEEGK